MICRRPCSVRRSAPSSACWKLRWATRLGSLPRCRVADVLTPQAGHGKSKWQQHLNKISAKHFDYLLCHPADLSSSVPSSSMTVPTVTRSARYATRFCKTACDSAVCRCCRSRPQPLSGRRAARADCCRCWSKASLPVEDRCRGSAASRPSIPCCSMVWMLKCRPTMAGERIARAPFMSRATQVQLDGRSRCWGMDNPFIDTEDDEEQDASASAPHCPRCAAPLVAREAKKGPHAGRLFLACSRFPECRYAAPQEQARH
ncbi:DUF2726 domain-containing protein [Aeromonas sp. A-5]|uniref:DUF2726 domain-containing protein n=1 Tax=Aeromonas ichthyocola TaxID=3367746 RepID=UPI0038DB8143